MKYKLKTTTFLLSAFCLLLPALIAQIEKKELKLTPEIEEMLVAKLKSMPEALFSNFGIKNSAQLENLHTGKPIPRYWIVNEKLEFVYIHNVSRMSDGDTLSLIFMNKWNVPVISDETLLLFGDVSFSDFAKFSDINFLENSYIMIEHFHNYEPKDSIIGCVAATPSTRGMDYLIIRKENQDIFVEIYDKVTGEYFKNEYSFSELINRIKELGLREKEARIRYYDKFVNKSELSITPEITEMLNTTLFSRLKNGSDEMLADYGIKDRSQLEHLHLGKPIPIYYVLENENLTFTGSWEVLVMNDGEPVFITMLKLENDGQYRWASSALATKAEIIHNYEHKDLIIGLLNCGVQRYLIIRKDNKDVFVEIYYSATQNFLKNECSLSEVLNLLKK